ncbi:amino acid permease [Chryseobacterium sp. SORGH_AS 447]|uniref:hypothetical protein n=1 Tax=Chryseobacterium sp. SORGH_AS_0447 TaxID=3041769 RepID=UPI0027838F8A|nr:hypothetical protein [Chryseobacterium sp. SORGH_AS_0447]MDQ1161283.1 amino acid permease [Chryseobacterium sp. SORGH_AS_0447]
MTTEKNYFEENRELVFTNVALVFLFSLFLTYKFWDFNTKLKNYRKIAGDAENHFEKESEILKSVYESYVNNYLDNRKKR